MKTIDYQDLPEDLQKEIGQKDKDGQHIWFVRKYGKKGYSEPFSIENNSNRMVEATMFLRGYRLVYFQRAKDSETPWLRKGVQPPDPDAPSHFPPVYLPLHFDEFPRSSALSISWRYHFNLAQPEHIPPQLDSPQMITVAYDQQCEEWLDATTGRPAGLCTFYVPNDTLATRLSQLAQEYASHIEQLRAIGQEYNDTREQLELLKYPSKEELPSSSS